jgi:hypothetical protein
VTSPLGSVAEESGRWYERDGKRYLSVTNILSKSLPKDALVPWAVKLTAVKAEQCLDYVLKNGKLPPAKKVERIRNGKPVMLEVDHPTYWKGEHVRVKDASAVRGNIIHDWAEKWVLGHEPDPPEEYVPECLGIMRAFEKYEIEPLAAEATFYNDTYSYAGTGDLLAKVGAWGGVVALLDYKTGNSCWPETAYQLAAYRFCEFIGLPDGSNVPVPETQAGGVLHVDYGTTHLVPYRCGAREFEAFKHMVAVAYEVVEEMKNVKDWAPILS